MRWHKNGHSHYAEPDRPLVENVLLKVRSWPRQRDWTWVVFVEGLPVAEGIEYKIDHLNHFGFEHPSGSTFRAAKAAALSRARELELVE